MTNAPKPTTPLLAKPGRDARTTRASGNWLVVVTALVLQLLMRLVLRLGGIATLRRP